IINHVRRPHSLAEFRYNPVMLDLAAPPASLAARALGPADSAAGAALSREAGWNQTERDWTLMLEIRQGAGLFAAQQHAVVATAIVLPCAAPMTGRRPIGFVSMVLVTPAWQRRGLATWLTERCVRALEADGCTPVLDATPAGQGVYRQLGFVDGAAL